MRESVTQQGWHNSRSTVLAWPVSVVWRCGAWGCLVVFSIYRLSVRAQLMLLVVAVLGPILVALLSHLVHERQVARDVAYGQVRALAHSTASHLDAVLRDHEALLGRIARRPLVKALDARSCDPVIAEFVKLHPEFTNLVVRDIAGHNDCSFLSRKITQAQLAGVPGYERAVHGDAMTVGDATIGPLSGRWISALFYPIKDGLNKTTGLVSLPMDLDQLNERLLGSVPSGALVVVFDTSGKIIMRSRERDLWVGKFVTPEMAWQTLGQSAADFSAVGADGVQRLFAFAPPARTDWRVVAGVPQDAVFAESNAAFKNRLVLVLGVLVLALGLAWRISLRIVRPIETLSGVAADVAKGLTTSRVHLRSSPSELWSVAQQLNHMLDAREHAVQELRESEARFRTLAALSCDWYWEQDANHRFVRFDGGVQDGTGIPSEAYVGKTRWELQALNLTPADWERHRAVLDAHQEFRNFEIQRMDPNGQLRWGAVSGTPMVDACGQFCGYRGVGTDISQRKRLEQERLSLSLHIEELSRRLVQAQEQTRRRFSRELHERTSPNLAALRINLDSIARASPTERVSPAFLDRVDDTRALIEDTTLSVREICAELHPPVFDCGGLLSVVQSYAQQLARRTDLQVHVNCRHGDVRLAPDLELSLFRIVQEALTNCAKHANARTVEVTLELDASPMVVTVTDDGSGFDVAQVTGLRQRVGLGLLNMRETAEFVGGRFGLESVPGRGTRVSVELGVAGRVQTL